MNTRHRRWIRRLALPMLLLVVGGAVLVGAGVQRSGSEHERIAAALDVQPGDVVADIGAGDGRYTWALARRVGEQGEVFATEVSARNLDRLRRGVESRGLGQVVVVEGDQRRTGLAADCCDHLLLRFVYHHFADPPAMREDMLAALRPGGTLLVVDFAPTDERVPPGVDRPGHGLTMETLVEEMTAGGWHVVERFPDWDGRDGHYAVLFTPEPDGVMES